jgi:uncharacterized Fe-S cluster protein YjdI
MSDPTRKSYSGSDITVSFDGSRCLHFAECLRGLPTVFDVRARPWITPDNAEADAVAEVVERCPSGALRYTRRDGTEERPPDPTVLTATDHGPILVHGNLVLTSVGRESCKDTRMALCSCGRSARRPFCDNACHS